MSEDANPAMKMLTSFMAGIILTGVGAFLAYPHNVVSKDDLRNALTPIQTQIDDLSKSTGTNNGKLSDLRVEIGRIEEHLGLEEGHQRE